MYRFPVVSLSFVALCMLSVAGCGPKEDLPANFKTSVELTYKGAPVEGAMVSLRPDGHEAPTATGVTGPDGKVQLFSFKGKGEGVVPGKYLVGVEKQQIELGKAVDPSDPDYGKPVDEESTRKERADLLPAKYISAADSGLTCTVTEDVAKNQFKFDLVD